MNETMINFDAEKFKAKLSAYGISLKEAAHIIGRSTSYWYHPIKTGKVNRSDFYMFHNKLKEYPIKEQFSDCSEKEQLQNEIETAAQSLFVTYGANSHEEKEVRSLLRLPAEDVDLKNLHDSIDSLFNIVKNQRIAAINARLVCKNVLINIELKRE